MANGCTDVLRASIIIVGYNSRVDLPDCLASLAGDLSPHDEVILVDNASTDGSAPFVRQHYPWVRLIESQENLGFGGGNNLGASLARGEFLVFLNPDTVVEPGWLAALLDALHTYPAAGLTTAKIVLKQDPERINTCGNEIHLSGLALCRGMGAARGEFSKPEEVAAVSGAAFAVRRSLFEQLGGFDETFFLYVEDTDLSLRARLAGWKVLYVPEAVVHHHYTLRFGPQKTYYQERNRYLMLLKCLRWSTLALLLPALMMAELITWGFVLLQDRRNWRNKPRAWGWLRGHWAQVMCARRQAQALRRVKDRDLLCLCSTRLDFEQAGSRLPACAAHWVFDPLFALAKMVLQVVVWR